MKSFLHFFHVSLLAIAAFAMLPFVRAQSADNEIQVLREQIRLLDQKLRVLERKQELKEAEAATAAKSAPKITINDKGFTLASADGAHSIRLRGLVQLDSRVFFDDRIGNNAFVLRRARLITEGTFAKNFSFQLVPEFGGTSAPSILDANLGIALNQAVQFKFGKFKSPVGFEQLQSDTWTFFNERSLVTNLVPNRDLGVQAAGELLEGRVSYALGIFNGVADGASSTNTDFDEEKDGAARVAVSPFKNEPGALQGLLVGVSGSLGREKTVSGRTAGYRTDGQQTFFTYLPSTLADGQTWRFSSHFDYRLGSFGLLGEYVVSTVNLRPSTTGAKAELQNKAWQVAAGYVLTGEDSSPNGVVPQQNFDFTAGTWGAFEVAARFAQLKIDDNAFPVFASASASPNEASSFGLGLNWYLSKTVRFTFDYYQTDFGFHASAPALLLTPLLRQDEQVFITRFQLTF